MHSERFDDLARTLAHGVTRRQVLKSLAAGAAAGLLSTLGVNTKPGRAAPRVAAGDGQTYLPVVQRPPFVGICGIPSRGNQIVNCSQDTHVEECRCIETAEGKLRCGQPALCGGDTVTFCTSSADCADLGPGYFCDSPGSGRCGDDKQRCLAPCQTEAPCPPELLCGTVCCEEGSICRNGKCFDPVSGIWNGTLTYEGQSTGIRFVLDRKGRWLSGRMQLQDPVSKEYLQTGTLTSAIWREGGSANWKISGELKDDYPDWKLQAESFVFGDFVGDTFTGTYSFPRRNGEDGIRANLSLKRA